VRKMSDIVLFPNSRQTAAKKLQQAMFTGRTKAFGNSLVATHGKQSREKMSQQIGA